MLLFAAILPPRPVLEELHRLVTEAGADAAAPSGKGLLGRLGRSRSAPSADAGNGQLDIAPLAQWYLPITNFGNVTLGDSRRLADALRVEASGWAKPELHFAGGAALEWPGDDSVWAKLEGDLDELGTIGRGVPKIVQRLGFFVDRRQFRPWLSVGTITPATTAPYLERVVAALSAHRSRSFVVESVSLMKRLPEAQTEVEFEELERMPLHD
jgi:RNA 2',3'-cyclic 3'-phosphodiesterase